MKKMILTEFRGVKCGFFRPKPVRKVGKVCPRCGSTTHVGTTTCEVKLFPYWDSNPAKPLTRSSMNKETNPAPYRPIYLTPEEAAKPFDVLVDSVRSDLTKLRGKIYDIQRLHPGWRDRVDFAEGGLT